MSSPAARWQQLTYTSVDHVDGEGTGGWQVKQSSDLTGPERARVLAEIPVRLTLAAPIARYPSEEELSARPCRLVMVPDDDGSAVLVHTVPAGSDATGRPGNLFTHVLLDRTLIDGLQDLDPIRPIQLWRSPMWLTPYGSDVVRAARFGDLQPVTGTVVTRATVIDFLFDKQHDRGKRFGTLLDAVTTALAGGPRVVMVADSVDEGAMWIGMVSFFCAPRTAARLSFSTYERVSDLSSHGAAAILSVVLRDDFHDGQNNDSSAESPAGLRFLDVSAAATPSDTATTAWAKLGRAVCEAGELVLEDRLLEMDAMGSSYPDGAAACPWWALAVAVVTCAELKPSWRYASPVILRDTPQALPFDDILTEAVQNLVETTALVGTSALWDVLHGQELRPGANPQLLSILRLGYLERALTDMTWLTGTTLPLAPDKGGGDDIYRLAARGADQIRNGKTELVNWPVTALRLVDFVTRCGVGAGTQTRQLIDTLLTEAVSALPIVPTDEPAHGPGRGARS